MSTPDDDTDNRCNKTILQWNCQGIQNKKDEIADLIDNFKFQVLAFQETKLRSNTNFSIPGYLHYLREGHVNRNAHGGVGIFVHQDVPHMPIDITTEIQAVAVKVNIEQEFTVCNIYSSPSHILTEQALNDLISQLPTPIILLGDLNGHNIVWGSERIDARGRIIEKVMNHNNLNILNNGSHTRITTLSSTAIDITACSPRIEPNLHWDVIQSPLDSDHCPITISLLSNLNTAPAVEKYDIKNASWETFKRHKVLNEFPQTEINDKKELIEDLYKRLQIAADATIPKYTLKKYYPKPWWSKEVINAKNKRESLYQTYRRNKTISNAIAWKKARAEFKALLIASKKESWQQLAGQINRHTPLKKVYEIVRRIKGKKEKPKINILIDNGKYLTSTLSIVNRLAEAFSHVSSDNNYSDDFLKVKRTCEKEHLDFSSDNLEIYNSDLTMTELKRALSSTRNTSPGPDNVHIKMLKNLPDAALEFTLKVMNKCWSESYFPNGWRHSTVVPLPKPNKPHTNPTNYRPIALTSVICKVMERMINERLNDFLEMKGGISILQCGCRKRRSTLDHQVRLETSIRYAFVNGEHLISVFFDLEKAYDSTWRFGIIRDLHRMGLRGRLPLFIQQFLKVRYFKTRIGSTYSDNHSQQNGIPQGSVLSVTLFAIKINEIISQIPADDRFHVSLFMDDLQVGYRHADLSVVQEKMQECLNRISKWATENGCKFSETKTKAMHFCALPGVLPNPDLKLYNQNLPYVDNIKFLGVHWDPKLTFQKHLSELYKSCQKPLALLRSITSHKWGADQKILKMIYNTQIRSRLDYGSIVFMSASRTNLQKIESIPNDALRTITGAFKTTPIKSLKVLGYEMPLQLRRQQLALQYYFKIRSFLNNPAHKAVTMCSQRRLFENKQMPPPFSIRIQQLIETNNIPSMGIKSYFSYSILGITTPSWSIDPPNINLGLCMYPKSSTPPAIYNIEFKVLLGKYSGFEKLYTDGSKTEVGVGAAVVCGERTEKATLPNHASIFTAEVHALDMAVRMTKTCTRDKFVIFSDSFSALCRLEKIDYYYSTIRKIQHEVHNAMLKGTIIEFCWVPGHAEIAGNERADKAAKTAAEKQPEFIPIHFSDWIPLIRSAILQSWNNEWTNCHDKMREVIPNVEKRDFRNKLSRRDEVIINRLRTGHTWFSHQHLINEVVATPPPLCEFCDDALTSVKHTLIECRALQQKRHDIFQYELEHNKFDLREILSKPKLLNKTIQFVKDIGLYDLI